MLYNLIAFMATSAVLCFFILLCILGIIGTFLTMIVNSFW